MRAFALRRIRLPKLGAAPQIVAGLLVLALFGAMAIEPTRQLIEQRERIAGMSSDLSRLERSNDRLEARIRRLRDPDYLEQRAREQVGLIRPGESAFVVMPPSARAERSEARRDRPPPPQPQEAGLLRSFLAFVGL